MNAYLNFPPQLRKQNQWILWKKETKDGKVTKVPYQNIAQYASSNNPKTWKSFQECLKHLETKQFDGLGYVFVKDIVGIDLDHCFDEENNLKDWAKEIVDKFPSYVEISPSGKGLHIFIYCQTEFKGAKTYIEDGDVERYCSGRYFTVTGNIYKEYNKLKGYKHEYFLSWHNSLIKEEPKKETQQIQNILLPEDNKILEVAFKSKHGERIKDLYQGNWEKHFKKEEKKSQSEADLSFVGSLMFFCNNDTNTADRIFRSSGLMREKWNRQDYREGILNKAFCAETMKWDTNTKPEVRTPSERKITPLNDILKMTPKPNPFLLQGMIVEGAINALTSDSGKGKSLLMLKMVEAIVKGEKFLNEFETKQCKTLIVDLEMSEDDIIDRTKTIVGKEIEGLDFYYAQTFNIFNDEDFNWLKQTIKEKEYKLVVLDTYSMMAPSKSENDNSEANIVNKRLLEITNTCDCTVLFLHHHRKLQKGEVMSQSSSRGATDIIGKTASHMLISTKDIVVANNEEGLKGIRIILEQMKRRKRTGFDRFAVNVWHNPFEDKTHFEFGGYDEKAESSTDKAVDIILKNMKEGEEYVRQDFVKWIGNSSSKISSAIERLIEEKVLESRIPEFGEQKNGVVLKHNSKIYYLL